MCCLLNHKEIVVDSGDYLRKKAAVQVPIEMVVCLEAVVVRSVRIMFFVITKVAAWILSKLVR